jgi:hypothetical protein
MYLHGGDSGDLRLEVPDPGRIVIG